MSKDLKPLLRLILWIFLSLLGLFVALAGYLSLRYSPEYMYREIFLDLGSPYDYRFFPERKLVGSTDPYHYGTDRSSEKLVQDVFQTDPMIRDLDSFLEDAGTQAFIVIQNDTVIYERYFMGYQRDSIVTSVSIAKSFDSAMIGIAIADGYIHGAQDPITEYIPELAERDSRFTDIQIRHLLMMASGLRFDSEKPFSFSDDSLTYAFDDLRHLALTETEIVEPPGNTFIYNNFNPLLLGLILERATGRPVTAYLQEKIWTPMGMEFEGSWSLDSEKSGFEKMESGINARAIDFAKLGSLYLNRGIFNGKQIVPAEWVTESIEDQGALEGQPLYYGYMWWGKHCDPHSRDFFALGDYGQFIYVSTAKNLVIVRNGERYGLAGEIEEWANVFCQFALSLP